MNYPILKDEKIANMLKLPEGKVDLVLDTDTFNEVDDQFAVAYALLSKDKVNLQAIYAAPFFNERVKSPGEGMEKSYEEILRVLDKMKLSEKKSMAFRGSDRYMGSIETPCDSDAVRDLINRAMNATDTLYVAAVGAITNIASAIVIEPKIVEKIVVLWLGGNDLAWRNTNEFNLRQDMAASRVVLDSGVPLVLFPCQGVISNLKTTIPELEYYIGGKSEIGRYLTDITIEYSKGQYAWSKVIWDVAPIAYLINPDWIPTYLTQSPILTDELTWSFDYRRHLIRVASVAYRDSVFEDLFKKMNSEI